MDASASSFLSDDEYDVISNPGHRSVESSIADLGALMSPTVHEPAPSEKALNKFSTVNLSAEDIQLSVRRFLDPSPTNGTHSEHKQMRIYVDGVFDGLDTSTVLQLRQAKLSFPVVHLMVGVFSDEQCQQHAITPLAPHVERCELVRHCRWVDEIVEDAPWQIDQQFLRQKHIDYVAIEEGITVDPRCHKVRLRGYDEIKRLGKTIPTKRTLGLARPRVPSAPTPLPSSPATLDTPIPKSPLPSEPAPDFTAHVDEYGIGY